MPDKKPTLISMPVIRKPPNRGPLFGGKSMILLGGYDKEAMRRWQERIRAGKGASVEIPVERDGADRDTACGDNTDAPSESEGDSTAD
ncbi:MAG: hypothetical protein ACJ8FS_10880 [Sphingomicrobium sp.]